MTTQSESAVRSVDIGPTDIAKVADGINALYDNTLDVIVVRNALPGAPLAATAERLDGGAGEPVWSRPNAPSPTDNIQLLGTPATPTYTSPKGPSQDAYLATANWYDANPIFEPAFDPTAAITRALEQLAGGRRVEILHFPNGRAFAPFTVRKLAAGQGISLHHDYHFPIALFGEIAPQLDTRTLVSFFVTLRRPESGGELFAYPVDQDVPNPPKLPNGWAWDLPAVEQRFGSTPFTMDVGDLFVFASGRLLHRVAPTVGPRSRITMGGFLALDKARERVLFWS